MLTDILDTPDAPPLLLVACYRSVDIGTSPFLQAFLHPEDTGAARVTREIALESMSDAESRDLARTLWPADINESVPEDYLAAVIRESQGNPYFTIELTQ